MLMIVATFLIYSCALICKLMKDLQMLQQNSYINQRYFLWLKKKSITSFKSYICLLEIFVTSILIYFFLFQRISIEIAQFTWIGYYASKSFFFLREKEKKKLVFTPRLIRLSTVLFSLYGLIIMKGFIHFSDSLFLLFICIYIISPIFLLLSNVLIFPIERYKRQRYYLDASRILSQNSQLKIIGVTGSYGKTSIKHFITSILSECFDVLMTPGSYNTTMGVVKTIRCYLQPTHEIFVVEMGARNKGDIREICNLTKPHISILSSVGIQHLESFKTAENIRETKFEIIHALSETGIAVLNADYELIRKQRISRCIKAIYYGTQSHEEDGYFIKNLHYKKKRCIFQSFDLRKAS